MIFVYRSREHKRENGEGFTCKLHDNRSDLVRVSSRVTRDAVSRFVEDSPGGPASVVKWKISSQDPGIKVVGLERTGLAGLLYKDEVDLCFVELGCVDVCKASQPGSGNQAVGFITKFYTLGLTSWSFQSPRSDTKFQTPPPSTILYPFFYIR